MSLVQLIDVSDLVNKEEAQMTPILEASGRHNQQDGITGITGMLLYSRGNFLQVLEREKDAVDTTYTRICEDRRHHNITLITEDLVTERHFAQWSMGYRHLSPEVAGSVPRYAPFFQFGFDAKAIKPKPGVALEMLQLFSQGMF